MVELARDRLWVIYGLCINLYLLMLLLDTSSEYNPEYFFKSINQWIEMNIAFITLKMFSFESFESSPSSIC